MATQNIKEQVEEELQKLPPWLRTAYRMLYNSPNNELTAKQENTLVDECLNGTANPISTLQGSSTKSKEIGKKIVIKGIGDIKNINLLTKEGLSFERGLNIIYGANGSGKTGYTRILNSACGNKFGDWRLIGNIDKDPKDEDPKEFTITCEIEGKEGDLCYKEEGKKEGKFRYKEEKKVIIDKEKELKNVNIFDKKVAQQYMKMPKGLKYVPRLIFLFEPLVKVYNDVKKRIEDKRDKHLSKLKAKKNKHLSELKSKPNDIDIQAIFESLFETTETLK
ncbi:MAG: ATP-binding protein, partial [Cytophagales bacterium]|nr:ATP-binding protein [Cytophagales bacterium]